MTIDDEAIIIIYAIMWTFPRKNQRKEHWDSLNFDFTDCRFQLTAGD